MHDWLPTCVEMAIMNTKASRLECRLLCPFLYFQTWAGWTSLASLSTMGTTPKSTGLPTPTPPSASALQPWTLSSRTPPFSRPSRSRTRRDVPRGFGRGSACRATGSSTPPRATTRRCRRRRDRRLPRERRQLRRLRRAPPSRSRPSPSKIRLW